MTNLKKIAAQKALEYVEPGMKLALGTGSTTNEFIKLLAIEVKKGLDIKCVASSVQTEKICAELGIELSDINIIQSLDLTIDGVDEVTPDFNAIKGGGGALLREKIVACASHKTIFIADETKLVEKLGHFPLPIEIAKFGGEVTKAKCAHLFKDLGFSGPKLTWRRNREGDFFITDGDNYILDAHLHVIEDAVRLNECLAQIPGVVEQGLFIKIASKLIIAKQNGKVLVI